NPPFSSGGVQSLRIRAPNHPPFSYCIILPDSEDKSLVIKALDAGADDFISRNCSQPEFLARLRAGERIIRLEASLAERFRLESERNHFKESVTAMEQVLGVVAHELRTPLAGLRSISEFLLMPEAKELAEWDTFLMTMNTEITRMAEMVNSLLEAARLNSGVASHFLKPRGSIAAWPRGTGGASNSPPSVPKRSMSFVRSSINPSSRFPPPASPMIWKA